MAPLQGSLYVDSYRENSSNVFSSETTGPIKAKFHMDPQWIGVTESYLRHLGHMTKMAAMPIYGKNPFRNLLQMKGPMAQGLVCSIGDMGPIKFEKIIICG